MSYGLEFLSSAEREFLRLPKADRARVGGKINALAENPRPPGSLKMAGYKDLWRIRVGVYRVVYDIDDPLTIVTITKVAHRREAYRGL